MRRRLMGALWWMILLVLPLQAGHIPSSTTATAGKVPVAGASGTIAQGFLGTGTATSGYAPISDGVGGTAWGTLVVSVDGQSGAVSTTPTWSTITGLSNTATAGGAYHLDATAAATVLADVATPAANNMFRADRIGPFNGYLKFDGVKVNNLATQEGVLAALGARVDPVYQGASYGWVIPEDLFAPLPSGGLTEAWMPDRGVVTSGGSVSGWTGIVASTAANQATGSKQPTHSMTSLDATRPSIDFDAGDGLNAGNQLATTGAFWVAAVVKVDVSTAARTVVAKDQRTADRHFTLQYDNSNTSIVFGVFDSSAAAVIGKRSSVSLATWYVVVGSYDGGSNTTTSVKLWIDGLEKTTTNNTGVFVAVDVTTQDLTIGYSTTDGTTEERYWDGGIAAVLIGTGSLDDQAAWRLYRFLKHSCLTPRLGG